MAKDSDVKGRTEHDMIRDLARLLDETNLSEIEIEKAGLKIRVARTLSVTGTVMSGLTSARLEPGSSGGIADPRSATDDPANHPGAVKSPMVGTAYRASEPGAAPFIDIGTRVVQGQTLLIIEAMKTMNHIPAPRAGAVTQILFENGQPVEFGEPLVILE